MNTDLVTLAADASNYLIAIGAVIFWLICFSVAAYKGRKKKRDGEVK